MKWLKFGCKFPLAQFLKPINTLSLAHDSGFELIESD